MRLQQQADVEVFHTFKYFLTCDYLKDMKFRIWSSSKLIYMYSTTEFGENYFALQRFEGMHTHTFNL